MITGTKESLQNLKEWGFNTHSFLSLYPNVEHFRVEGVEGYIPYAETSHLILVAGDPIAAPEALRPLVDGILKMSLKRGKRLGMIPCRTANKEFLLSMGFDAVYIGKEPIFDLQHLPKPPKSIRQAVNRALRRGIQIIEYDQSYKGAVEKLSSRWQGTREVPALQFLFQLRPLELHEHKKLFLAVDSHGELIAFLSCSPIYGRNGWYLEDLIRDDGAPNGTSELLLTRAMEKLSEEGFAVATLALAPLAGLPDRDENHPWVNRILRLAYRRLSWAYHFQTLEFFKSKFKPSNWEQNYFYFYPAGVDLSLVKHLLEAFLGSSLFAIVTHKMKKILPASRQGVA